jgi:putative ABC transport system permease protein
MRLHTHCARSLLFFWRTNLAVVLGAAVGAAALTGALIVGDSMRASLQEVAVGRLGRVDYALLAPRFFRAALANDLAASAEFTEHFDRVCPIILLNGGATHAERRTRADRVSLLGVDDRFWAMNPSPSQGEGRDGSWMPTGRVVILNEPLAQELGAAVGDDVLLRTGKPSAIATETLLGRRDDTVSTLRLTVAAIIPAEGLGAFGISPRQTAPKNAYLPLETLQRALQQSDRINAVLVAAKNGGKSSIAIGSDLLHELLRRHITLADVGLKLRVDESRGYLSLESESILLPPPVEEAALAVARETGLASSPVLAHLANTISAPSGDGHVIPYSTVAAIDPDGALAHGLSPGEIMLNDWAAEDLQAKPGDSITMTYYMTGAFGKLETRSATFTLRGVLPLDGPAADPGFIPEYHGITDTASLADWNPPFPIDLRLVRDKDEDYWRRYRTTPKAFVTLADGQRLWADQPDRFGRLTSIRLTVPTASDVKPDVVALSDTFARRLLDTIDIKRLGLEVQPIRERAIRASEGNTDFGMLFIGFSSFLILSAMMLVALLFRLGIERRSHEIGLLLAMGFSPRRIAGLLLAEGAALAIVGAAIGLAGASVYAWLMLAGLRSWWSNAVHTPFLRLHLTPKTVVIGFLVSVMIATASAAWSIRGLTRRSPRSLLSGTLGEAFTLRARHHRRLAATTALAAFAAAILFVALSSFTDLLPKSVAFFLAGASMLTACLAALAHRLQAEPRGIIHRPGPIAVVRLGLRNAPRHLGRSMLTAGLIASATFVIISLEAFRIDADADVADRRSGTGGFTLYAESAIPLPYDISTAEGREGLNVTDVALDAGNGVTVTPFRLRPGDESSCLNLYQSTKPRILGVSEAMIRRGGFRFATSLAATDAERENPWTLLNRTFPDGAVAAIGDEAAVKWQLHLDLGKDLAIQDEGGRETRLRFVALLQGSVLQSELLVADSQFIRMFPSITGQGFFLIDAPREQLADVERTLERALDRFSFDAAPTSRRLAEFLAVQNTYLNTFQSLGGIGLLLGTAGLAVVLLRNVWERRGELSLMRTLGFTRVAIAGMVLSENAALLIAGLFSACFSALIAVSPVIAAQPSEVPWCSLATTLAAVFLTGIAGGVAALVPAMRAPVLTALRAE